MEPITPDSPEAQSADLVAENISKLKALFPEIVTEGAAGASVNVDVLKQLLGDQTVTDADEKYGLNWHGKRAARQLALTPSLGTLRPCPDESKDWETTQNLFIEGDNLEVLKLLQKSYAGKVKLIYIDPPYNTGKDFVYPDNFKDNIRNYKELTGQVDGEGRATSTNSETSGRYHTDWLNMMYPRLKIARNLLNKEGIICISIDSDEVSRLRDICNEIFGEENFIADMILITGANQSGDGVKIQMNTENCLVYAKSIDSSIVNRIDEVEESFRSLSDAPTPLETRKEMGFTVYYNEQSGDLIPRMDYDQDSIHLNTIENVYTNDEVLISAGYSPIRPGFRNNLLHRWRWNMETFINRKDEIVVNGNDGSYNIGFIQSGYNAPKNILKFGTGTKEVKALFDETKVFDYPKSTKYIGHILKICSQNDGIILDFFAGSGTTGHSVYNQNFESVESDRKYILVQLPEPLDPSKKEQKVASEYCDSIGKPRNIAELTKERLRRSAAKIQADNPDYDGDLGFRVFKLDSSNIKEWNAEAIAAAQSDEEQAALLNEQVDHLLADRTEDDILYELLLKLGLDLCVPIETREIAGKTVHAVGGGVLMVCLCEDISYDDSEPLGQGLLEWHRELDPATEVQCVFRDAGFAEDKAKSNLVAILEQNGLKKVRSI